MWPWMAVNFLDLSWMHEQNKYNMNANEEEEDCVPLRRHALISHHGNSDVTVTIIMTAESDVVSTYLKPPMH